MVATWLAGAPVDPARILVVLDDLALPPGVDLRGGHAGCGDERESGLPSVDLDVAQEALSMQARDQETSESEVMI